MSIGNRHGVVLKRKIFVGGVNPALGNDVLKNYFSTFGPVEDATIMRYADGRSRGFGFVVFLNEATCTQVLEQRTHPVTAHDKVEVKPCLSRCKTRPIGLPGHHGNGGYKGVYDAYRGGAPPPPISHGVSGGPHCGYNSYEYNRNPYMDSRSLSRHDVNTVPTSIVYNNGGGNSNSNTTNYSGPPNEYGVYNNESTSFNVSVPYTAPCPPWVQGYREESSRHDYPRSYNEASYTTLDYYPQDVSNVNNSNNSLSGVPLQNPVSQREDHTIYPETSQTSSAVLSNTSQTTGPPLPTWMNRVPYTSDVSNFNVTDTPRGNAYTSYNSGPSASIRHGTNGVPSNILPVSQGSNPQSINRNTLQTMVDVPHGTHHTMNRRTAETNYSVPTTGNYLGLNNYQRNVPY